MYITLINPDNERVLVQVPDSYQGYLSGLIASKGYERYDKCSIKGICRNCRVKVLSGLEKIPIPDESEMLLLQGQANVCTASRLACRIEVSQKLNGIIIQLF